MQQIIKIGSIIISVIVSGQALADQFHYNNIIIGDRAVGFGGAWGGVSDDASGVFYNPAGLGFALSNDVSGSANAYYDRKVVYKKAVGDLDFTESSAGSVPSFFGGMQKLDNYAKGLVFAFGIYNTDSELKDQNDLIENQVLNESFTLTRFHRTVNQRGATFFAGGALGYRLADSFSVGFGLNYVTVSELVQEYQDVHRTVTQNVGTTAAGTNFYLTQNIRQNLTAYGIQPVFGIQGALAGGMISLGLTAKFGTWVSDQVEIGIDKTEISIGNTASHYKSNPTDVTKGALGSMPAEYRLGTAFFASTRLLVTLDFSHYVEVTDAAKVLSNGVETIPYFNKEAVTNLAAGLEYYIMPQLPIRLGVFTNNDARPEVDKTKSNQPDHIDYIGESIFFAWVQPNTQIAIGLVLQQGSGEAQKVVSSAVQEVEASSTTVAFSATSSF